MRAKFHGVLSTLNEHLELNEKLASEEGKAKVRKYNVLKSEFERYCNKLPVVGFNSQPLIKRYLPSSLERLDTLPNLVICKENSYMVLETKRLQYLDLTNYLAAGTSLSASYKAYVVTDLK